MVVAGTIGYRTASGSRLMNYDEFFADAIGRPSHERRYRVCADLERIAGRYERPQKRCLCACSKARKPIMSAYLHNGRRQTSALKPEG
jgi:hypothetical protein